MPRSTAVVPVVLDNRVQHLGKLYIHNIRAAQRLPLGTSDHVYSNHYTSVCRGHLKLEVYFFWFLFCFYCSSPDYPKANMCPSQSFVEEDVLAAKLHWLRHRANGLFRRRPDPDELRGRPRYRDWE